MRIRLRGRQIDCEPLRRSAEDRLHVARSRFSQCISLVIADLRYDAGASAGLQKVYPITVNLLPKRRLVDDKQEDVYAPTKRVADEAARAVKRALNRERDREVSPLQPKATGGSRP